MRYIRPLFATALVALSLVSLPALAGWLFTEPLAATAAGPEPAPLVFMGLTLLVAAVVPRLRVR